MSSRRRDRGNPHEYMRNMRPSQVCHERLAGCARGAARHRVFPGIGLSSIERGARGRGGVANPHEVGVPIIGGELPSDPEFHDERVFAGRFREEGEDAFAEVGGVNVDGPAVVVVDQVERVGGIPWRLTVAAGAIFPQGDVKRAASFRLDDFCDDFLRHACRMLRFQYDAS